MGLETLSLKPTQRSRSRLAWLEGVRITAAVMILLYHAQLLLTDYAYTPQPTGLLENGRSLVAAGDRLGLSPLLSGFVAPIWFGFQFVDVFVLISGFSLVLSLKGQPLNSGSFLKQRFLRILFPFWTVVWMSYPILWLIGTLTGSYIPHPWHFFAAASFPLLFDFAGDLLLAISGPWWFVSLILSFTLVFPFLWRRLQRWGARNLLVASFGVTIAYRTLAVFLFGGHPTYVILDTPANWLPFLAFIAKLSTFVVGMVVAQQSVEGRGVLFWQPKVALQIGIPIYLVGFVAQFSLVGWIVADLLTPIGLSLIGMALFKGLESFKQAAPVLVWLGSHSYSYFLIHNFVVDRTLNLFVQADVGRYYLSLPGMILATLILALAADRLTPGFKQVCQTVFRSVDAALTKPTPAQPHWRESISDRP